MMRPVFTALLVVFLGSISVNSFAATYQYKMVYKKNSLNLGDLYADVSGSTPTALQAALTSTLTQTGLSVFVCYTNNSGGQSMGWNEELYLGNHCTFKFPNQQELRSVTISAIAAGTMSGNVLTGSSGGGTVEEPFSGPFASAVFLFFLSSIISIWYFTKNIGAILEAVRRW